LGTRAGAVWWWGEVAVAAVVARRGKWRLCKRCRLLLDMA